MSGRIRRGVLAGTAVAAALAIPAASAQAHNAYVANLGGSSISVFDTATDSVVAPAFGVGNQPVAVAITPDGTRAYVANLTDTDVSVIDTKTNAITGTIPLPPTSSPSGIAITPDGTRAYVTSGDGNVYVIDTATNTVVGPPILVTGTPDAIAITPDGTRAYVTDDTGDAVVVLDTQTNAVIGSPILLATGSHPRAIAITPDGTRAYVTDFGTGDVSVIATATNAVVTTIGAGTEPWGIGITPDGRRAYVVNDGSDNVSVIDTVTNTTVGSPIPLPGAGGPRGLAISPNGAQAYAVTEGSHDTRVIDTASNTQVGAIPAGGSTPNSLAVVPDQPPRAVLTASAKGMVATLNGGRSTDPDGSIAIYGWGFGDGNITLTSDASAHHAYVSPGEYTATLVTSDNDGCSMQQYFTGQTVSCNGSMVAVARRVIAILRLPRPKLDRRSGTATLSVKVPGPGTLTLAGARVVSQRLLRRSRSRTVAGEGTVKLRIRATVAARRKLRRSGQAKVRYAVTFRPPGGDPNRQVQRLTLVRRR